VAIAFVKNGGVNAVKAAQASLSVTVPAGGHAAGNLVVVVIGYETSGSNTNTVLADSRGNTWTQIEPGNYVASRLHICQIWACVLTTALQAGDTITATLVGGGNFNKMGMTSAEFSGATIVEDVTSMFQYNATATATPSAGPKTPPSAATLILGALEWSGPNTGDGFVEDSDTAGGDSWHTVPDGGTSGGSATANVTARLAYKISTSSVAQTYNPTHSTARSNTILIASLQAAVTSTPKSDTDSGSGLDTAIVTVPPVSGSYTDAVAADTPVAWYRMDETSGLIQDSSGNANHATVSGGTSVYREPGAIPNESDGKAIKFDGFNSFSAPDHATLDVGDVFTVEAWVKRPATTGTGYRTILSRGSGAFHVALNYDAGGTLELHLQGVGLCVASSVTISDTNWHHVVVTKNGGTVKLYLDSVDVTGSVTPRTMSVTATTLDIAHAAGAFIAFQTMDEIALYASALSAARVLAHYQAATGAAKSGTDSGTGVDVSTLTAIVAAQDAGTGVENGTASVPISVSDSGIGSDASATNRVVSDSSVGVDAISIFVRQLLDSGIGADAGTVLMGTLGQWLLNESPAIHGTTIADSSGAGNNGTLSTGDGSTDKAVAGRIGGGITFDGINDYIGVNNTIFNSIGAGDFTVSAWVRNTDQTQRCSVVGKDGSGAGQRGLYFILNCDHLAASQPGMITVGIYSSDSVAYGLDTAAGVVSPNVWHHIVYRRSAGVHTIWVDAVSVSVTPNGTGLGGLTCQSTTTEFRIGARSYTSYEDFFEGDLDHIAVYSRALSDSEIAAEFAAGGVVKSGSDSGVGSDSVPVFIRQLPDSGVAVEDVSVFKQLQSDTGVGADTGILTVPYSVTDSGVGSDTATLVARYTQTDAGTSIEFIILAAAQSATDSGTATEIPRIGIALTDSGTGAEVISALSRQVAEAGSGTDASALSAGNQKSGTDSGTGTDAATVVAVITTSDTGVGTEIPRILIAAISDTGSGAEITGLQRQVFDSGAGTEQEIQLTKQGIDSGTAIEFVILTVTVSGADTGTGADTSLKLGIGSADSGSLTDNSLFTARYVISDTGTGLDAGLLLLKKAGDDFGTGYDDSSLFIDETVPEFHQSVLVSANGHKAETVSTKIRPKVVSAKMGSGNTLLNAKQPQSELSSANDRSVLLKAN
jgi:Concanavalin A-like lectin/glucanases superfamily